MIHQHSPLLWMKLNTSEGEIGFPHSFPNADDRKGGGTFDVIDVEITPEWDDS